MTPRPSAADELHRLLELLAAVAAHALENVARDALAVHAHEHGLAVVDVAHDEGNVLVWVDDAAVGDRLPGAVERRDHGLGHALDELLVLLAVGDELLDADDLQVVALRRSS